MRLGADNSFSIFYPLFEDVITKIYNEAGFCAVSIPLPSKRIEKMLLTDQLDADWGRTKNYSEEFNPALIAISRPLFQIDIVFLSMKGNAFDGDIENLKGQSVAYQTGFRWLEKNLPLIGATPNDIPAGIPVGELLERGRIQVYATDSVRANAVMETLGAKQSNIRVTIWQKVNFYHMVHERHRDKIPALEKEINQALDRGDFDEIHALPGLKRAD